MQEKSVSRSCHRSITLQLCELQLLLPAPKGRAVIIMGSPSDKAWATKIADVCKKFGVPTETRVSSAHKATEETLRIVAQYEGEILLVPAINLQSTRGLLVVDQ